MIHDALLVLWDCSLADTRPHPGAPGLHDEQEVYGRICEIARSHHRIQNFIDGYTFRSRKTHAVPSHPTTFGLYAQALSEGMDEVLQSYKQRLMEVESQILGNHNYTLSFVYGHVEEYRGLFNTLNRMISSVKEQRLRGCQILSLTHQHILSGNEVVREAVLKIFAYVNKVFVNQLCSWLLYGELKDQYQEFFIYCQKQDRNESKETILSSPSAFEKTLVTSYSLLEHGYNINTQLLPHFMPLSLAQEILFIGKTVILFGFDPRDIKKSSQMHGSKLLLLQKCANTDSRRFTIWDDNEAEFHEKLQQLKSPEMFEVSDLRVVVNEIKVCVTKHLWVVIVEEAQLLHELRLMKDFFLLGRGELFLELLRLSSHVLDMPTTRTSTRDMNQAFQLAARAVLLSNSSDLEKFSFDLPYIKHNTSVHTTMDGSDSSTVSDGWSSIILRYHFKWPLHLLFTPEVLARYNDMFRLLLRIKKTQHDLHALWKSYKQSRSFSMCQLHNKLMFLMDNLQHYLQADVLETNFSKLMDATSKTNDFEELKRAHATFLTDILGQSFLSVMPSSEDSLCLNEASDTINNPVLYNIMDLLRLCHSFCSMSQTVDDKALEAYHITGYTERFDTLVAQLLQLLASLRMQPCGTFLARLLMRLDYNRWFSSEARLTHSVTNMLY